MKLTKKKVLIGAGAGVAVLALGTGAYAFWTTSGSGTGTAQVGSATNITLHASVPAGIYPGGEATVTVTADSTNSAAIEVGTIHLDSVVADGAHSSCDTGDFTMDDITSGVTVAPNTNGTTVGTGTLKYAETGGNQDGCQGATLTLTLSSL